MKAGSLFVTYDGLTDPLGGSQILPYLRSIAAHPRTVHVLSFEKPERFAAAGRQLAAELAEEGIGWTPLAFSRGGKLAKVWDLARMYSTAVRLTMKQRFRIVHCRSYQAAQVGCLLKRWFGLKVLFDMRGLWVDERVDGGIWQLARGVDRLAYRYYKRIERSLLECADHVVALTDRVVPELRRLAPRMRAEITVIPCCADFTHFKVLARSDIEGVRGELGIPADAFVLGYLGSLGTWYCLEEMLDLFIMAAARHTDVHMLLITRDWQPAHAAQLEARGGADLMARLHVRSATREEVPALIGSVDVMLSFIKPAYSKMASSPTKLAEAFACGVPVICNRGIGDVDMQVDGLSAGVVVDLADTAALGELGTRLEAVKALGGQGLRDRAKQVLDLPVAADGYRRVYDALEAA